ncbi:hypothetical protein ACKWTF_002915 [Chironomus riparius]
MSDTDIELEKEFKKFRLEEIPLKSIEEPVVKSCNCSSTTGIRSSLLELSISKIKTKDRRGSNLIKPARLKLIGSCYAKLSKNVDTNNENDDKLIKNVEDFTSEAFLKMRITPHATNESPCHVESPVENIDKDDKLPSTSSSLNCSTQAKLQQQMSSTEFDSTIDEMSDFLAYHLSLFNHRDKYLIDSMYT